MLGMNILLDSLGIKIKPEEIEAAWEQAKDALPKLAKAFEELNERMKRVEFKLDVLMDAAASQTVDKNGPPPVHSPGPEKCWCGEEHLSLVEAIS